jgi:hypothetical protein
VRQPPRHANEEDDQHKQFDDDAADDDPCERKRFG